MLRLTAAGAFSLLDVDNATIDVASNALQVKDLGVSAAKIADDQITSGKIAQNYNAGTSSGNGQVSGVFAATGLTCTITSTGGDVTVLMQADGTSNYASFGTDSTTSPGANNTWFQLRRNGTVVDGADGWEMSFQSATTGWLFPPSTCEFVDKDLAAGTYTYELYVRTGSVTRFADLLYCKLVAFEDFFL
jgi:hypothetical protein